MSGRLTHDEECRLCARARNGDDAARNRLATAHMGLAVKLARRASNAGAGEFDDLLQEALLGIFHAARKYRPGMGTRFGSYASIWMRQRIGEASRKDRLIRVPAHSVKKAARPEFAAAAARVLGAARVPLFESAATTGPAECRDDLWEAVATLPPLERRIVARAFGLDGDPPSSLRKIAAEIGCAYRTVREALRRALGRLRDALGDDCGAFAAAC